MSSKPRRRLREQAVLLASVLAQTNLSDSTSFLTFTSQSPLSILFQGCTHTALLLSNFSPEAEDMYRLR